MWREAVNKCCGHKDNRHRRTREERRMRSQEFVEKESAEEKRKRQQNRDGARLIEARLIEVGEGMLWKRRRREDGRRKRRSRQPNKFCVTCKPAV